MHSGDVEMVERGDMRWDRKTKPDRVTLFGKFIMFISTYLYLSHQVSLTLSHLISCSMLEADLSGYGFEAKVLHLPGHSKGSMGILTLDGDLFCGDLLMNMFKPDLHFMIDDLSDFDRSIEKLKQFKIFKLFIQGMAVPFLMEQFLKNYPKSRSSI